MPISSSLSSVKKRILTSPLPIGFGQTISQPTTVKFMLSWLDAMPGDEVLDIGSGSGWTSALLADIVGPQGIVYAVERIPELVKFGRDNCRRLGIENVFFFQAGKSTVSEGMVPMRGSW